MCLSCWTRESELENLLPSLRETVYVGISAGSMVTAPVFGETYDDPETPFVISAGMGLVDFALLLHLDHENHPERSSAKVERMAAEVPVPTYWIDDETAIKVTDGTLEAVSEGRWELKPVSAAPLTRTFRGGLCPFLLFLGMFVKKRSSF